MQNKDYSYLDDLASEVYAYMYNKLIHKMTLQKKEEELVLCINKLSSDEKKYLRSRVMFMFDELKYNHSRKK